ncbi:MAG: hypothetical protein HYY18_04385 [Planctomycetes bacterium]|nr:hypothetical protein [Planctomycetota bacterium]
MPPARSGASAWISVAFGAVALAGALAYSWWKQEEALKQKPQDIIIQTPAPIQYGAQPKPKPPPVDVDPVKPDPGVKTDGAFERARARVMRILDEGDFKGALVALEAEQLEFPGHKEEWKALRSEIETLLAAAFEERLASPAGKAALEELFRLIEDLDCESADRLGKFWADLALSEAEAAAKEGSFERASMLSSKALEYLQGPEKEAVRERAAGWLRLAAYSGLAPAARLSALGAADLAALEAAVTRCLYATPGEPLAQAMREFEACKVAPADLVAAVILRAAPWDSPAGDPVFEHTLPSGEKRQYAVSLPENYLPARVRPLAIWLTPGGSAESCAMTARSWRANLGGDLIVAVPLVNSKSGWGPNRLGEEQVPAMLKDLRKRFVYDEDFVWISGVSAGAHGVWFQACRYGDRYSAYVALAGAPYSPLYGIHWLDFGDNLNLAPARCLQGAKDTTFTPETARKFAARAKERGWFAEYLEFPDAGHEGAPVEESLKTYQWAVAQRRDPYPKKFHWSSDHLHTARCSWVEIAAFLEDAETVRLNYQDEFGQSTEKRDILKDAARVDVEVEGQEIRFTTVRAARLRVYWSDRVVDLAKPVTIRVNGKEAWKGVPQTSVRFMVEEARRTGRRDVVFGGMVEVEVK